MLVAEEAASLFLPETAATGELRPEPLRAAVRRAADGVLLLRNIDELTAEAQVQLLRYIRSLKLRCPPKSKAPSIPRLRLSARRANHCAARCSPPPFLPEIYYRLSAVSFSLPALRDRKEDIPALAQMFIDAASREQQRPFQGLGPGSLPVLLRHTWPGNVRELESVIRAACLAGEGQWLRPIDLVILPLEPAGNKDGGPALPENYTLDGVIRRHILVVLKACDGNKARAAAKLGISRLRCIACSKAISLCRCKRPKSSRANRWEHPAFLITTEGSTPHLFWVCPDNGPLSGQTPKSRPSLFARAKCRYTALSR